MITSKKISKMKTNNNVDIEIIMGRPSKECHSLGICKILPVGSLRANSRIRQVNALDGKIQLVENNMIRIEFNTKDANNDVCRKYFSGKRLTILDEVELPKFVVDQFGESFTIPTGKYALTKNENLCSITVRCSKHQNQ